MIVSWGRPTEMSPGSTVDQVLWDTCVKYCYNSMYCVLAYGNDSSCTLFDFGDVSTVEKLDPEENLKVAMKINNSTADTTCPTSISGSFPSKMRSMWETFTNSNYNITFTGDLWKFSYQDKVTQAGSNYALPYTIIFPDGHFKLKQSIVLIGYPSEQRWFLNIESSIGEVLFHFNPRPEVNEVVRSTHRNGVWEMYESSGGYPFTAGQQFNLTITNSISDLQMYINQVWFADYRHRTPNPAEDYVKLWVQVAVYVDSLEILG
ncbi:Galectin [Caenorhabditis elegans]|nr:Galectin [Caenorhabditis elegans]CAB03925.3 Galectin [Caenorhabditis elegans]|eukprot:NP_492918.2 Galectin [Caenorhabditis elegans]